MNNKRYVKVMFGEIHMAQMGLNIRLEKLISQNIGIQEIQMPKVWEDFLKQWQVVVQEDILIQQIRKETKGARNTAYKSQDK